MSDDEFQATMSAMDPKPVLPVTVCFTVPGQPVAKGRPIAGRGFNGRTTLRTPEKTLAYEGLVAATAYEAMNGRPLLSGPLAIDLDVGVQIPKALMTKSKQHKVNNGEIAPTKKPDLDNVVKAICDGLNGVAYADDSQIVEMSVRKRYSSTPSVRVVLRVLHMESA